MLYIWPVAVPQLYLQCELSQVRKYKVWWDQHECITTTYLTTHAILAMKWVLPGRHTFLPFLTQIMHQYLIYCFSHSERELPIHSHHHEVLWIHTNDIIDLWSEQLPGEVKDWAVRATTEKYRDELLQLIQPQARFHFWGTQAWRQINSEWDEMRGNQLAVDVTRRDALSKQRRVLHHKPNRRIPPQQLMPVAMENKKYIRFKIQTKIR